MSSLKETSALSQDNGVVGAEGKPHLTEEEKKQNHLASGMVLPENRTQRRAFVLHLLNESVTLENGFTIIYPSNALIITYNHILLEHKRRQAIREAFGRLTEIVPGLEGRARSEGLVLKRTVEYMRQQIQDRRALIEYIEESGGDVDEELKK